eukprot:365942-Chlamydomonas_euryale.AAC.19
MWTIVQPLAACMPAPATLWRAGVLLSLSRNITNSVYIAPGNEFMWDPRGTIKNLCGGGWVAGWIGEWGFHHI